MAELSFVGIAVLDRVFRVTQHATVPGKYRATERMTVGGGVAANAAVTASRLGATSRLVSVVGDDDTGRAIVSGLNEEGIDVTAVQVRSEEQSPESIVQIDADGERLIVNHASPTLFTDADKPSPATFTGSDAVLVDMRWAAGARSGLEAARAAGRPGIVDCDHDPADSPGVLEAASHIVFAAQTLKGWTQNADLEAALAEARERTGAWVAATEGADGTTWLDVGGTHNTPAFPVEAVDTLGAGDVFHGAFAVRLAEGASPEMAIRFASAAAALKCERFGGRAAIPSRDAVDRALEERWS